MTLLATPAPLTRPTWSTRPTNRLLAALSAAEFEALQPHLKPVLLTLGQILYKWGRNHLPRLLCECGDGVAHADRRFGPASGSGVSGPGGDGRPGSNANQRALPESGHRAA